MKLNLSWESFSAFSHSQIVHHFSQRGESCGEHVEPLLWRDASALGYPTQRLVEAEQIHGAGVAVVDCPWVGRVPGVDALVTRVDRLPLVIRVADCGPVYFHDPVRGVIALAHSGRKGTELNITGATLRTMRDTFNCQPADIRVQLGPCIRPPHYEVAFAEKIAHQARAEGVGHFQDCGTCTAADLDHYYSYRAEKGRTGRMWAILMRTG